MQIGKTKYIGSCTLYGAIGNALDEPVYAVGSSTNRIDFHHFLWKLIDKLNGRKPYIVYDGHSSHETAENDTLIQQYFIPLQLPAYSSEFNSIETLWAHLKRVFKTKMLQRELTDEI